MSTTTTTMLASPDPDQPGQDTHAVVPQSRPDGGHVPGSAVGPRGEQTMSAPAGPVLDAELVEEYRSQTAYEVAFDEEDQAAGPGTAVAVPVDAAVVPTLEWVPARLPIIPAQLRPVNLRHTLVRMLGRAGHVAAFHAVRCPWYAVKLLGFAARGLALIVAAQVRWWWVPHAAVLERAAAMSEQVRDWERVHTQIRATRSWRGTLLAVEALTLILGGWLAWTLVPRMWLVLLAAAVVLVLGRFGRPAGRTVLGTAVVKPRYRRLTSDIVLRAYYAAGLGHPDKPGLQVQFGSPMARDARNSGSQVLVDLPYGKGWSDVAGAREKLASGLDVTVNQVFLTPDASSTRRHLLFVADRDPLAVPVGRTELLDGKPRSIWAPVRFGRDERGNPVELSLLWVSVLIGAQPRKGKTFAARLLALHAALDPWVRLIVVDGKNSPDWAKFRLVAHRMVLGTVPNPNDTDPVGHLLATLDEVLAHIERVNQQLAKLPVTVCPEGKLTEDLARDPRYPDLRVVLLVMEEFQVYFETDDQPVNKDIAAKLSRIQAVGPSAGVCLLSSSQKPSGVGAGDVGRLFNRYRDNHTVRFALKCGNRLVSEAVLGGDAYAEGFDASTLPVGDQYRGVGLLYGCADHTPTVRTFLADHTDAETILTAARAHRQRLGLLTGLAAGEPAARPARDVLADTLAVFGPDDRLHWATIATRLAQHLPEHYTDLTADTISTQLRALGVPSININRDGQVRKGAKATDIHTAHTTRTNHPT